MSTPGGSPPRKFLQAAGASVARLLRAGAGKKIAPGKFHFTLWTSYGYLQYADRHSWCGFDVAAMEDVWGASVWFNSFTPWSGN